MGKITTLSFKNHFDEDIEIEIDEKNNITNVHYDKIKIESKKIDKTTVDDETGFAIHQEQEFSDNFVPNYLPTDKIEKMVKGYHNYQPRDWEEIMAKLFIPIHEKIIGMKRYNKKEKNLINKKINEFIDMEISFNELLTYLPRY